MISAIVLTVFLGLIIVPSSLFIFSYGRKSPWRSTVMGKIIMTQAVSMDFLLILVLVRTFFPDWPPLVVLRILMYLALAATFWWMYFLLRKIQREERKIIEASSQASPPEA